MASLACMVVKYATLPEVPLFLRSQPLPQPRKKCLGGRSDLVQHAQVCEHEAFSLTSPSLTLISRAILPPADYFWLATVCLHTPPAQNLISSTSSAGRVATATKARHPKTAALAGARHYYYHQVPTYLCPWTRPSTTTHHGSTGSTQLPETVAEWCHRRLQAPRATSWPLPVYPWSVCVGRVRSVE